MRRGAICHRAVRVRTVLAFLVLGLAFFPRIAASQNTGGNATPRLYGDEMPPFRYRTDGDIRRSKLLACQENPTPCQRKLEDNASRYFKAHNQVSNYDARLEGADTSTRDNIISTGAGVLAGAIPKVGLYLGPAVGLATSEGLSRLNSHRLERIRSEARPYRDQFGANQRDFVQGYVSNLSKARRDELQNDPIQLVQEASFLRSSFHLRDDGSLMNELEKAVNDPTLPQCGGPDCPTEMFDLLREGYDRSASMKAHQDSVASKMRDVADRIVAMEDKELSSADSALVSSFKSDPEATLEDIGEDATADWKAISQNFTEASRHMDDFGKEMGELAGALEGLGLFPGATDDIQEAAALISKAGSISDDLATLTSGVVSGPLGYFSMGVTGLSLASKLFGSGGGGPSVEEQLLRQVITKLNVMDRKLDSLLVGQRRIMELVVQGDQLLSNQIAELEAHMDERFERSFQIQQQTLSELYEIRDLLDRVDTELQLSKSSCDAVKTKPLPKPRAAEPYEIYYERIASWQSKSEFLKCRQSLNTFLLRHRDQVLPILSIEKLRARASQYAVWYDRSVFRPTVAVYDSLGLSEKELVLSRPVENIEGFGGPDVDLNQMESYLREIEKDGIHRPVRSKLPDSPLSPRLVNDLAELLLSLTEFDPLIIQRGKDWDLARPDERETAIRGVEARSLQNLVAMLDWVNSAIMEQTLISGYLLVPEIYDILSEEAMMSLAGSRELSIAKQGEVEVGDLSAPTYGLRSTHNGALQVFTDSLTVVLSNRMNDEDPNAPVECIQGNTLDLAGALCLLETNPYLARNFLYYALRRDLPESETRYTQYHIARNWPCDPRLLRKLYKFGEDEANTLNWDFRYHAAAGTNGTPPPHCVGQEYQNPHSLGVTVLTSVSPDKHAEMVSQTASRFTENPKTGNNRLWVSDDSFHRGLRQPGVYARLGRMHYELPTYRQIKRGESIYRPVLYSLVMTQQRLLARIVELNEYRLSSQEEKEMFDTFGG